MMTIQQESNTMQEISSGEGRWGKGVYHYFHNVDRRSLYKEIMLYRNDDTRYEEDEFNSYQNFIYKRALFGLSVYEDFDLGIMHWDKKKRIIRVSKRAQEVLNVFKQEAIIGVTNRLFYKLFPESPMTGELIKSFSMTDPKFINTLDFKSLGITKKDIINKLILEKILPDNFYDLKPEKNGNYKVRRKEEGSKEKSTIKSSKESTGKYRRIPQPIKRGNSLSISLKQKTSG